jgi:DNA-binding response OmpR family regulator
MAELDSQLILKGTGPTILVISDRPETGPLWVFSLQRKNWTVILESNLDKAEFRLLEQIPDLVLFDTQRPDERILNLVRKLRAETANPILMLVHATSEDQVVNAYAAGADECVVKPIGPALIIAKVRAWMRHTWKMNTNAVENIRVNHCVLLVSERKLTISDRISVKLTNLELRVLHLLMSRSPRAISNDEIIERVWDYAAEADFAALKNLIYRLRQKIEVDPTQPRYLQTAQGVGYKFIAE